VRLPHRSETTVRLRLAERPTVGSVRSGRTSPYFWAVTAFSRYAERVGFALSACAITCVLLSSSALGAHRFGKPLMMHGL
jgi:hypothetical protein